MVTRKQNRLAVAELSLREPALCAGRFRPPLALACFIGSILISCEAEA